MTLLQGYNYEAHDGEAVRIHEPSEYHGKGLIGRAGVLWETICSKVCPSDSLYYVIQNHRTQIIEYITPSPSRRPWA